MIYAFGDYFFDPLIRASSLASLFLGAAAGLVGVWLAMRRNCLMAETMSHASYPGLMLSVMLFASSGSSLRSYEAIGLVDLVAFIGAWFGAMLGLSFYSWMMSRRIGSDSALCWVLASFLGVGVLIASRLQFLAPRLYQRAQSFLYGQAATLTDSHLILFFILWLLTLLTLLLAQRSLMAGHFDRQFAKTQGIYPKALSLWIHFLTTALLVTGIRAGGVLVMASLLIAPAVFSRILSRHFMQMMIISMVVGGLIGFFGNWLSLEVDGWANSGVVITHSFLPTGPAIALVGFAVALLACLFAPKKGWFARYFQLRQLKRQWLQELAMPLASQTKERAR